MKLTMEVGVQDRALVVAPVTGSRALAKLGDGKQPPGVFLQLIAALRRTRNSGCGLFAFTSATPQEGVTSVVQLLAAQLAAEPGERVLVTSHEGLCNLSLENAKSASAGLTELAPSVWSTGDVTSSRRQLAVAVSPEVVAALRRQFSFVLVDCKSLRKSPEALRVAQYADGVLLVVGAGEAKRTQVEQAQRAIQIATSKLLGCVLNKRTYPIPDAIYRHI